MNDGPTHHQNVLPVGQESTTVYVVRQYPPEESGRLYRSQIWSALRRGRTTIIVATIVSLLLGSAYALLAPPWYRAEVLLMPVKNKSAQGLLAQFGGLASLAGLDISAGDDAEPLAVLRSRSLPRQFIEKEKLITVLLSRKWDAQAGKWKGSRSDWPDIRDAVKYFDKRVRRVNEDRRTGLVTLVIEWKDPVAAAAWANDLARMVNEQMRSRAIRESTNNIAYLRKELENSNIIAVQQSVGRLLEVEFQRLMMAKGSDDFSFRIVDEAVVPKKRFKPLRTLVVSMSALLGALAAALFVCIRELAFARKPAQAMTRASG
jgi:uncharacterized protein involved in exopolysaccharide biosynthesis